MQAKIVPGAKLQNQQRKVSQKYITENLQLETGMHRDRLDRLQAKLRPLGQNNNSQLTLTHKLNRALLH